jgi:hypothetical protein
MFIYIDETGSLDEELKDNYFGVGAVILTDETKEFIENEYLKFKEANKLPDDDLRIIQLGKKGKSTEEQRKNYTNWLLEILEKLSANEFQFLFTGEELKDKEWIKKCNDTFFDLIKSDPIYSELYKEWSSGTSRKNGKPSIDVNGYSSYISFIIDCALFAIIDLYKRNENTDPIKSIFLGLDETSKGRKTAILKDFNEIYKMKRESILLLEKIHFPSLDNVKIDFQQSNKSCFIALVDNLILMKRKGILQEHYKKNYRDYTSKVLNQSDFEKKYLIWGRTIKT